MYQRLYLYLSLVILASVNVSFAWPVRTPSITSTFGEARSDHFHDGIDVVSPVDRVYPVEPGSLVYLFDRGLYPLENYPGAGNFAIVKHQGDRFSFYMHLEDGLPLKRVYGADDHVGLMGNTGRSNGKHLHFSLVNGKNGESLNPLIDLPSLKDAREPRITDLYLKVGDRHIMIRNRSSIRLTQHYPALVRIEDSMRGQERLGIYKLAAFMNGSKVLEMDFRSIIPGEKGFQVSGLNYDAIYDSKGLYRIDGVRYVQGKNELKIVASDYSGNTAEKTFIVDVTLETR